MKVLIRAARWALPFLGFAPAAAVAAAGAISPSDAPAGWVHYAEDVTAAVTQWLESPDEQAVALRESLVAEVGASDPASPLILSLWIDGTRLSRVDFPSSGKAKSDADLRAFLTGRHFDAAPPPNMRQPMRIAVELRKKQD